MRAREREEAGGVGPLRLGPGGVHREIARIMELAVGRVREQPDRHHVLLHDDRDHRGDHVGGVGPDQQVDLVDVDELRIDAGHVRRVALIVVAQEIDRAAEQPALRIDVVAPDLERDQELLADAGDAPRHRHAAADLDRLRGVRGRERGRRQRRQRREPGPPEGAHPQDSIWSATKRLRMRPSPSISVSITSPTLRKLLVP